MLNNFLSMILSITRKRERNINAKPSQFDELTTGDFMDHINSNSADLGSYTNSDKYILELQNKLNAERLTLFARIGRHRLWITGATILFGAGSFLGFNALGLSAYALPITLIIAMMGVLAGLFLTILPILKLDRNAKDELIPHLVAAYASGTYMQNPGRRMREYRGIGILPSGWTDEKNEDEITGCVDGIEFKMFETRLTHQEQDTNSQGVTTTRTVVDFDGVLCDFKTAKSFDGHTIITRDYGFLNSLQSTFSNLDRVFLEDVVFEKKFAAFSTDQIEARYLLTVSFMERLLDIENRFPKGRLQAAFSNDRFVIMIRSRRNLFEVKPVGQLYDLESDSKRIIDELARFIDIARDLGIASHTKL